METTAIRARLDRLIADGEAHLSDLIALRDDLDGDPVEIHRQGRWTRVMLAQIWEKVAHLAGVRTLFEITAERPGQIVTYRELLERSGLDEVQQRNEHARLSRVSAELFGAKRWPIENWQGPAGPGGGPAEMLYRMPEPIAAWFHELT